MTARAYESSTRSAHSAKTRRRALDAARAVFSTPGGFAGFSLEAVAKQAGVTRVTIYKRFGSRRLLLEAVLDDMAERGGLQNLQACIANPAATLALQSVIAMFCAFWGGDTGILVSLHAAAAIDPDFAESLNARNERRRHVLHELVDRVLPLTEHTATVRHDWVDTMFMLTSLSVFVQLHRKERSVADVCAILEALASDATKRARNSRYNQPSARPRGIEPRFSP